MFKEQNRKCICLDLYMNYTVLQNMQYNYMYIRVTYYPWKYNLLNNNIKDFKKCCLFQEV